MDALIVTTPGDPITVAGIASMDVRDGVLFLFGASTAAGAPPVLAMLFAAGQWLTLRQVTLPDPATTFAGPHAANSAGPHPGDPPVGHG